MSLIICKWRREFSDDLKREIRKEICEGFGRLNGISSKYFAVLFDDYQTIDFPDQGIKTFVLVYQSEGKGDVYKDAEVSLITDAICRHTGWTPAQVSIQIIDVLKGSIACSGRIVNRNGTGADAIKNGELN